MAGDSLAIGGATWSDVHLARFASQSLSFRQKAMALRAVQDAKRLLKVRSPGLIVTTVDNADRNMTGTTYNPKGPAKIMVSWDDPEELSSGTYLAGVDEDGEEGYHLFLVAAHSYVMVQGVDEECNGCYVMRPVPLSLVPEYVQVGGPGLLRFNDTDSPGFVLQSRGRDLYKVNCETLNLPATGWNEPKMEVSFHELKVGEEVILRRVHVDSGIPLEKYPGTPCSYNEGDVCVVEKIDNLFFAPKVAPDQWMLGEDIG